MAISNPSLLNSLYSFYRLRCNDLVADRDIAQFVLYRDFVNVSHIAVSICRQPRYVVYSGRFKL